MHKRNTKVGLLDVFPASAVDDCVQGRRLNAVFAAEGHALSEFASPPVTDFTDLFLCDFGVGIPLTNGSASASAISVAGVVKLGSKDQMAGVYTGGRIASVSHDSPALDNWPVVEFIAEAMHSDERAADVRSSVSVVVKPAYPEPAWAELRAIDGGWPIFVDLGPESLDDPGFQPSKLNGHSARHEVRLHVTQPYILDDVIVHHMGCN